MIKKKNNFEYERDIIQKKAIKFLKKKNYTFVKRLGSGSYGDVIAIRRKDSEMMAAKIMQKSYTSPGEMYLWPCLKHPNVLPLLESLHHKNIDIFLTPVMDDCLDNVLKKVDFRNNSKLFQMTIDWMKDMLTGLEYMHGYGVCHMDIKVDNILISSDLRALISDFSGITETKEPVNRFILPKLYCPPEIWTKDEEEKPSVEGDLFDVWAAGQVIFYCFSDRWIEKKIERMSLTERILSETGNWMCDVYPSMYKCLQEPFFSSLLKKSHPSSEITNEDCLMALNLLRGILRCSPGNRPSAKDILNHPLLSRNFTIENLVESDEIWISKQEDSYEPKMPDKKTNISQVSAFQSFEVDDEIDEVAKDSQLAPSYPDIDAGKENSKCGERNLQVESIQHDIVKISDVQTSKDKSGNPIMTCNTCCHYNNGKKISFSSRDDISDVVGVKEKKKGNICKRIRDAFNCLRTFFTRKKSI